MNQEEQKLLLNQVRHRILQYVLRSGSVTVREIGEQLSDVPQASLYRQVKLLNEKGFLVECGNRQVRGTLEHTYRLAPKLTEDGDCARGDMSIQFALLSIAQDFNDYYADENTDPKGDMVSLTSTPLMLSDSEFESYLDKINEITRQYMNNKPGDGRRARKMTFVSSPIFG